MNLLAQLHSEWRTPATLRVASAPLTYSAAARRVRGRDYVETSNAEAVPQFRTHCSDCAADLGGYFVLCEFIAPHDVVELFDGLITLRTATAWFREPWSCSQRPQGLRHRIAPTREFVRALLGQRRDATNADKYKRPPELREACPGCGKTLGGVIAPLRFLTVEDVAGYFGAGATRDTVTAWIHRGELPGFHLGGIRGLVIDEQDLVAFTRRWKPATARRVARA